MSRHKVLWGTIISLVVLLFSVTMINGQIVPLLNEGFESTFPPAGWSTSQTNGNNQWKRNDSYSRGNYTPGGNGYCADNDDDQNANNSRAGNNALTSPPFDATNFQTVWAAWDVDWYPKPGLTDLQGRVEAYNGTSWVTISSYMPNVRVTTRDSVNITAHAAGKTTGRIRFVYNELSGGVKSYWFEVDDVAVWGSQPLPPPDTLDLAITAILRPLDQELPGKPFFPSCRISNNLDTTAHPTVRCVIKEIATQQTVYEDALNNYPCQSGSTDVTGFKSFTAGANKVYTATFTVQHPDDKNPTNNSMSKNFNTVQADITPIKMILPETPDQFIVFPPTADFAERLGMSSERVTLRCKIELLADMEDVYEDSIGVATVAPRETITGVFDTVYLDPETYVITFWVTDYYFVNVSHPPLVDTFNFVGVEEKPEPTRTGIELLATSPFSTSLGLKLTLTEATCFDLSLYDAVGRKVATLMDGGFAAGTYERTWDAENVPQGVYFVKFTSPERTLYRKVTKIR